MSPRVVFDRAIFPQFVSKMAPEGVVSASKSSGINWHLRAKTTLLFHDTVHSNSEQNCTITLRFPLIDRSVTFGSSKHN